VISTAILRSTSPYYTRLTRASLATKAIDIILGGPPCVDYSAVNAYRKGVHGEQGQYLLRLGKLVHAIRKHKLQRGHPLFFLAENVVLRDKDLDEVSDSFGITPLEVDAHYYSPCRRKRHFFMNYPVDLDFTTLAASSEVASCLEEGWMHPADAIKERACGLLEEAARLRKANSFMASLIRLDDERMTVVKKSEPGGFVGRSLMVVERERMMGFPEAYVSAPRKEITLICLCILVILTSHSKPRVSRFSRPTL
jgi:site-specific DNA-cytosine methylase